MIKSGVVKKIVRLPYMEKLIIKAFRIICNVNPDIKRKITKDKVQLSQAFNESINTQLSEIPSETSMNERVFLYRFFRDIWSGKGHVIEIGPFLGGTTRAIGLGMAENPNIGSDSHLITYDRFKNYYTVESLINYLTPLISEGRVDKNIIQSIGQSADFYEVFHNVHKGKAYSNFLQAINEGTPERSTDLLTDLSFLKFDKSWHVEAFFIDGCKSWFGTKYFMNEALEIAKPGSYFIFQDYAWYTCFWLPSFINSFKEYFTPFCNVDNTYVFRLCKKLDRSVIELYFPDKVEDFGLKTFDLLFKKSIQESLKNGDSFLATRQTMQYAAAMAYIGHKKEAKEIFEKLRTENWFTGSKEELKMAMVTPTYSPDGDINL